MNPPPIPPNENRAPADSAPPPLPSFDPDAVVRGIPEAEGLTHRQVLEEISMGGRFVTFLYVISIVILTFRRGTTIAFLRPGKSGAGSAWGASLTTAFIGWWGIPWGPIHSIHALFKNAMGGKDVTEEMLTPLVGAERAKAALKLRPKPKAGIGIWSLRAAMLAFPATFLAVPYAAHVDNRAMQQLPGNSAFHSAEESLHQQAGGNTPQARAAAAKIKAMLDPLIEGDSSATGVWVEFQDHAAAVLVRMPGVKKLSPNDRETLVGVLWPMACHFARSESGRGEGSALTVGLKGGLLWRLALFGKLPAAGQERSARPAEIIDDSSCKKRVIASFPASSGG